MGPSGSECEGEHGLIVQRDVRWDHGGCFPPELRAGSLLPLPAQECHISLLLSSADAAEVTGVARPAEVTLELPGLEQEWQQEAPHEALVFLVALRPYALRDPGTDSGMGLKLWLKLNLQTRLALLDFWWPWGTCAVTSLQKMKGYEL